MGLWELLVQGTVMATILGVFLTGYAMINGRATRKMLIEESKSTKEILLRIEQNQTEARKEMAEAFKKMDETLLKISQGQEQIARLIASEAEKTRQAVKT